MKSKISFWQKMGMHDWFLKKGIDDDEKVVGLTTDDVYKYIVEKFQESVKQLSFANRLVFYHEYIICFNVLDYEDFMDNKKGLFGLISQESVKNFYETLNHFKLQGKTVEPSANKWVFRFVSHPDYARGDKSFIGKLLPGNSVKKEENLRVTFIPRQTGIAQTFDINEDILKDFTFYSEGYFEIPYRQDLVYDEKAPAPSAKAIARLETTVPDKEFAGKKLEYLMKDSDIIVSGKEESRQDGYIFRIPSEWVGTPHLRIRHDKQEDKFFLASFGEKTILNEQEVKTSEQSHPHWVDLPVNSRIVLNGIVGINIFKS